MTAGSLVTHGAVVAVWPQIVVADLWAAYGFKTCDVGQAIEDVPLGAFNDIGSLTMFGP